MIKRVPYHNGLCSFWVERKEEGYVAYRTFKDALLGIIWPSAMFQLGQTGLRAAYLKEVRANV